MINTIVEKLAAYTLPIVLVALAAALSWGGVQTWRLKGAETELAQERAERAIETIERLHAARVMAENNARLQAEHAAKQQETVRAFNDALKAQEVAAAAAAADADSLRDAVACYAAGDCLGPRADTATGGTCSDRAATLGKLLTRTDRLAGRLAAAADRHANEVRALQAQILADRKACGETADGPR